jgi:BirA family biotin operon repressor/biotin-[acetyl-CoA-carboxylase] ligase
MKKSIKLTKEKILEYVDKNILDEILDIEIFEEIDSTNNYLLKKSKLINTHGLICTAEHQTAGKGQHGRYWHSPANSGVYFSIAWKFQNPINQLSGLSIEIGLAVKNALENFGVNDVKLKWPNDIMIHNKKVSGILIETYSSKNETTAIIGIGINIEFPKNTSTIDQPWIDLSEVLKKQIDRNMLTGILINYLLKCLHKTTASNKNISYINSEIN